MVRQILGILAALGVAVAAMAQDAETDQLPDQVMVAGLSGVPLSMPGKAELTILKRGWFRLLPCAERNCGAFPE